jgi:hypothetical protein
VYKLLAFDVSKTALNDANLLRDVVEFKQKFYPSAWANYHTATPDGLVLQPSVHHIHTLKADYEQMQEMLFGEKPSFEKIIKALVELEDEVHSFSKKQ